MTAAPDPKDVLLTQLRRLVELTQATGMKTLATDIASSRIPKLMDERFFLVVLGEFNHGKSTFVNALLGADVLPVGITPTTAAINHVVWSQTPTAQARLFSGETVELTPDKIAQWVTVAGGNSKTVEYVRVGYPAEFLRKNVTLIDTPGVNDINEQRADITYGYVPRADAVIFLLDANQALKDSEREFLASRVLTTAKHRLVFVVGKLDLLSTSERADVMQYVTEGLSQLVAEPVVFGVSAKNWLEGKRDDSGIPELLEYLAQFLAEDRRRLLLDNAAADGIRTAAYVAQTLGVKQRTFDLDVAELSTRILKVREQLKASKRTLDELHDRIAAEGRAVRAQVHLDLEGFARQFVQVLPAEIDAVDADDVKKYLTGFIEDRFREWAELEGDKVASLLEKLAEDVIAVTNENVHATADELAHRLGPNDTKVDIEVDSFKYDVAVYSVGALGTGMFFFVSTLAGGLLTLAAPILAIVLKSKIAGDIREQAKERAPAAILRAAQAMRPHFDSCVDDFCQRLSDFVRSAGNALYKGISEVLDRAIDDRTNRKGEIELLREEAAQLATDVKDVRLALEITRAALWTIPADDGDGGDPEVVVVEAVDDDEVGDGSDDGGEAITDAEVVDTVGDDLDAGDADSGDGDDHA